MAGPSPNSDCPSCLARLAWFAICLVTLALVISGILKLWIALPWWKLFRRCVSVSAGLALWGMARKQPRQFLQSLGLGPWRVGKPLVVRGLLLGGSTLLGILASYLLMRVCRIHLHPDTLRIWRTVLGFVPAVGLIALLEELVFRGYILHQLLACSKPVAVLGSSTLYALVHLRSQFVWPGTAYDLIGLFLLGGVLALSVLKTKQLYLAMGLHAAFAYGAIVNKLFLEFTTPSLRWLVGTNHLVNGVIAWLAFIGLGILIGQQRELQPKEAGPR